MASGDAAYNHWGRASELVTSVSISISTTIATSGCLLPYTSAERLVTLDSGLFIHWETLTKFQIELQHIDSRLAQDSQLPSIRVSGH